MFQTYWYMAGYSGFCIMSIVLSALSNLLGQYGALKARKLVHQRMIGNIILSPLSFFDATPIGRIDNCFSNDLVIIDKVKKKQYTINRGPMSTYAQHATDCIYIWFKHVASLILHKLVFRKSVRLCSVWFILFSCVCVA